jgi:hypothetical protein
MEGEVHPWRSTLRVPIPEQRVRGYYAEAWPDAHWGSSKRVSRCCRSADPPCAAAVLAARAFLGGYRICYVARRRSGHRIHGILHEGARDDTKKLAEETRDVVKNARAESEQRERHHRESLAPLISARGLEAHVRTAQSLSRGMIYRVTLMGTLRNSGPGPATEISVLFTPRTCDRREFPAEPIGAGAETDLVVLYDVGQDFAGANSVA